MNDEISRGEGSLGSGSKRLYITSTNILSKAVNMCAYQKTQRSIQNIMTKV